MKRIPNFSNWLRIFLAPFLTLILMLVINKPGHVASQSSQHLEDRELYQRAYDYIYGNPPDPVQGLMYLFAYIQRDPPDYVNNTNGWRDNVDNQISYLIDYLEQSQIRLKSLEDAKNGCSSSRDSDSLEWGAAFERTTLQVVLRPLLPDALTSVVCDDINYRGKCKTLSVGSYDYKQIGLQQGRIFSVQVGSKVKVTVYVFDPSSGPSLLLKYSTPDLSKFSFKWNNRSYPWNNNVNYVKVELK